VTNAMEAKTLSDMVFSEFATDRRLAR